MIRIIKIVIASIILLLMKHSSSLSETIYVPQEYQSIQVALYFVSSGDSIVVAPGTYNGDFIWSGNTVQDLHIIGAGAFGDSITHLTGTGSNGIYLDEAIGWEITGLKVSNFYVGIYTEYCSYLNVHHNYFLNCSQSHSYGWLSEFCDSLDFHHNVIDNISYVGVRFHGNHALHVYNNVVVNTTGYHGFLIAGDNTGLRIINNIIAFNDNDGIQFYDGGQGDAILDYNDNYGNGNNWHNCSPGIGCISLDPMFTIVNQNPFNLQENSPCIDAGDPDYPLDPDSTRADIGAFYFDQYIPPVDDLVIIIENENVILTWIDIPNAQRYFIYRDTIPNFQISTPIGTTTTATYSDSSALLEEKYFYKITYR